MFELLKRHMASARVLIQQSSISNSEFCVATIAIVDEIENNNLHMGLITWHDIAVRLGVTRMTLNNWYYHNDRLSQPMKRRIITLCIHKAEVGLTYYEVWR